MKTRKLCLSVIASVVTLLTSQYANAEDSNNLISAYNKAKQEQPKIKHTTPVVLHHKAKVVHHVSKKPIINRHYHYNPNERDYFRAHAKHRATCHTIAIKKFVKTEIIDIPPQAVCMPSRMLTPCCPAPMPTYLHDGFYVGGSVGYDSYKVRQNANVTDDDGNTLSAGVSANPTGFVGGVLLGFGKAYKNRFYLGAEIFGTASSAANSNNIVATTNLGDSVSYSVAAKAKNSYGVAVLPGFELDCNTLIYAKLGYNYVELQVSENLNPNDFTVSTSTNETVQGFSYGLGIERAVYKKLSVRGEFVHTDYNSFTSHFSNKFSNSNNQFMTSFVYHFC